jgi:hypothetical protein
MDAGRGPQGRALTAPFGSVWYFRQMPATEPDAWPREPIEGVTALLQPVAHVLMHAKVELPRVLADLSIDQLWAEPAGVACIGFHLAHLTGNIDRLFTHARGQHLTVQQRLELAQEGSVPRLRPSLPDLLGRLDLILDGALAQLRAIPPERLLETRDIGTGGSFATVLDLLASAAEHTSRHLGQIVTTATVVRGLTQQD